MHGAIRFRAVLFRPVSVPRPRPNRCALAIAVTSMLPPLGAQRRLRRWLISGLTGAASAPAVLRFAFRVAAHAQGSLPAGRLGLCRVGSRTHWTAARGFISYPRPS